MRSQEILHKVKMTRLSQNWSQKRMATVLGVSVSTYSRFERGITKTNYTFLQKVCDFLKINLTQIEGSITNIASNYVEEERVSYAEKKITISTADIQKLIQLLEQQQNMNKHILSKLKYLKTYS